jgi:hypothetical protein
MRWGLVIFAALFAQQVIGACLDNQKPLGGVVTTFPVPAGAIADTKSLFPEGARPSATLTDDIFIAFTSDASISITFMWEGAGYRNVFGYFLYDTQNKVVKADPGLVTVFQDVSQVGDSSKNPPACMTAGDTVNISRKFKAGDVVGFWIVSDGYPNPSARNSNFTYYSINTTGVYNKDLYYHAGWAKLKDFNDIVLIGFEDLWELGDHDFNDVMFYLTINGTYNSEDIPTYTNGTLEVCAPSEIVEYNEVNCTQYALLTARNPLDCQAYIGLSNGWVLAADNAESKDAIVSFGPEAGCIVLANGNGYNYTRHLCASGALKNRDFANATCFTVGCDLNMLVKGQAVTGCTGIPNTACNPAVKANIVNKLPSTFTPDVAVNPLNYGLFLNKKSGAQANQVLPFSIGIPAKTKVEIQILLDLNGMTSTTMDSFSKGLTSIHNLLVAEGFIPSIGLSSVDSNGQLTIRPITASADALISQGKAITVTGSTSPTSKIWGNWVTLANSATAAGWSKSTAYRFIVVVSTRTQNGNDLATAQTAHINKMIAPIVLNTDLSSYSLSGFKFFGSAKLASDWTSDWTSKLVASTSDLATTLRFTPVNDIAAVGTGFVKTLPADIHEPTASTWVDTSITVQYPAGANSVTFPYALKVILWGYDLLTINVIINRDPVINAPMSTSANWNETKAFTVSASDEDGNILTISYTSITPAAAQGLIKNSKGVVLTPPVTGSDFSGTFAPNGWDQGTISLVGTVSDGCSATPFTYTFTAFQKPNTPPNSASIQYTTLEDTSINVPIPRLGDQEDPESALVAQIIKIEGQGTFYLDESMTSKLTPSMFLNTISSRASLYYVPPPNVASTGTAALAYFTFFAIDSLGVNSKDIYTVSVVVTPVNDPPVYTGDAVITIDEDTRAEIGLRDYLEDVDTDVSTIKVIIGKNVQRGNLYECVMTETGCNLKPITTVPYLIDVEGNPSGRVVFVPLPDENGENYAQFQLIADDGDNKPIFTITINVRPVNDPPVIIPFFSLLPTWNEMDEDTEYVLSWNVTDIDSPLDSLTVDSRAFPQNLAGKLYQYVPANGGYTRGDEITGSGLIPRVSAGIWSVIVVPNPNIYDNTFLRLRLTAYDNLGAPSMPVNAPVRVLPINDAPVIAATEQTLTRTDSLQITLGFISVSDIDAGRKNVNVSFTVQDTSVGHFGFDSLTSREERLNPCTLNAANTSVLCSDDLASLNEKWFKVIVYYPGTSGSQIITVFADDLGHTDKWDRPLTDTKLVAVSIGEDTGLLTDPGTDNTLTIAVAVSVAGAVAAVALVLFLIRDKLAGQTDAYFESLTEPLSTGGVNPVYKQAGHSGQNPTYVPRV